MNRLGPKISSDKPGQHQKELNPYWKDGGTGLPSESLNNSSDCRISERTVGDAGLNWLRRAYKRVKEQAEEENRSMEEVAAERWGSLKKLETLLGKAENKCNLRQPRWKKVHHGSYDNENEDTKFDKFRQDRNNAYESYKKKFKKIDNDSKRYDCNSISKEPKLNKSAARWMNNEFQAEFKESSKDANLVEESPIEKEEIEDLILTDKEMNELGAKILKEEMLGNLEQAEKFKVRMIEARKARENSKSDVKGKAVKTNNRGFTQPVSSLQTQCSGKKKKQVDTYDTGGKRICYFPDDDKYSLKQMFEKEKKTTSDDQNAEFARHYSKQFKADDSFLVEASKIKPHLKQEHRDRSQAIQEHKRRSSALEKCLYCLDSSRMKKHLIVSLGKNVYLSMPSCQSLVDYHCYIVPMAHVTSGTLLDEDIWAEIKDFQKGLIKMFDKMDKIAVFMETSIRHRWQPHCFIECIPMPKEDGDMAPMYFKKAILESETEWALNKKLIDLYKKDLLHSVPRGLPYFSVHFGAEGGFAHVIEDEKLFPSYFGKEIIGGMLDIEPFRWRKYTKESFEEQSKKVLEFTENWKKC